MKQSLNLPMSLIAAASLLGGALTFTGCSEPPKPEPTPMATPAPMAMATPAEAPKPAGDLGAAKVSLEKAVVELKAKNYAGAASAVDAASTELTAMAANSSLPDAVKSSITKAAANLAPLKALIEKKDASAEKGLMASVASLGKLADMTKALAGAGDAAKGAAAGAAGALGNMMKGAAEKGGAAAGATKDTAAEKAGAMMPKKQ